MFVVDPMKKPIVQYNFHCIVIKVFHLSDSTILYLPGIQCQGQLHFMFWQHHYPRNRIGHARTCAIGTAELLK